MTFFEHRRKLLCYLDLPQSYTITHNYTHVTSSNEIYSIEVSPSGTSYGAHLTADAGYVIDSITILMSGVDITESCGIDDGWFTIPRVTGDIVITAIAIEAVETSEYTLTVVAGRNGSRASVTVNGEAASYGEVFAFNEGERVTIKATYDGSSALYGLSDITTVREEDGYSTQYDATNDTLTIVLYMDGNYTVTVNVESLGTD